MRQITIYTTDKEYNHFVELAKNLHYVKKIETDDESVKQEITSKIKKGIQEKNLLIEEIKEAVGELKLIRQGKLKGIPASQLLDKL